MDRSEAIHGLDVLVSFPSWSLALSLKFRWGLHIPEAPLRPRTKPQRAGGRKSSVFERRSLTKQWV